MFILTQQACLGITGTSEYSHVPNQEAQDVSVNIVFTMLRCWRQRGPFSVHDQTRILGHT